MGSRRALLPWILAAAVCLLAWTVLLAVYDWLPADGATGDLESFGGTGYRVQWLLEERAGGLLPGDLVVRAGGKTAAEWLSGTGPGPEWRTGGTVTYEIQRGAQVQQLNLRLAPIPLRSALHHWLAQAAVALAFLLTGMFVGWQRPGDPAARVLLLFCTAMTFQIAGDAYNFQFSTLPWRWPFWLQVAYEHGMYSLCVATLTWFALLFPTRHPLLARAPRLLPATLLGAFPVAIIAAMALAPGRDTALRDGNHISWAVTVGEMALAFAAGIRSVFVARDPVSRVQVRWIMWCGAVGCAILLPGYVLPIVATGRPWLPHPLVVIVTALVPFTLAVAILRFRLFDIQVFINRTLLYGTLTALLAGLYLGLAQVLGWVLSKLWPGNNETAAAFIAAMAVVLGFDPLRRRVRQVLSLAFYRADRDYQRLVQELSAKLATSTVVEVLPGLLTVEAPARLQISTARLAVLNPEGQAFVHWPGEAEALPATHPLPAYLQRSGRPLLRLQPGVGVPPAALNYVEREQIELAIPLVVGDKLVGIYSLGAKRSGEAYTRDQAQLLQILGHQAAVAVENSRLFEATRRQAAELAGLHVAAVAISSSLEIGGVLSALAEQLGRVTEVSHVSICQLEDGGQHSRLLACWTAPGVPERTDEAGGPHAAQAVPENPERLLRQEVVVLQAGAAGLGQATLESIERHGWHSALIVPLVVRDQVLGYAELWETRHARTFSPGDVRLCSTLAADAAAAIDRARLYQAEREQRHLAEALEKAADLVSRSLELDQVLDHILDQVEQVVPGDAFNIMLVEGEWARVVRWRGYRRLGTKAPVFGTRLPIAHFPNLARMMISGQPAAMSDTADDPDWVQMPGWEWVRSYVSAPIQVAGQTVGFLNVDREQPGATDPDGARRLEAFARHVASAVEHARLYEQARQEIVERRHAEEQLTSSLAEKEVLLREIHHRVKNNLQVISSLLYLQSRGIEDPGVLTVLNDSQHRVHSMAMIHEQLYQSGNLARVDAADYVRTLASYLFRSYQDGAGQVRMRIEAEPGIYWPIDTAVPCGLLINELLANSFKHAFPAGRSGQIYVELRAQDGGCQLVVGDDGVGLPPGTIPGAGGTLGLQLVQTLAAQLHSSVEIDSSAGTRFDLGIPLGGLPGGE